MNKEEINLLDKYFRLLNYMSLGMIYLKDNPLLKRDLTKDDIKNKLVGHWGSAPGQNFIYTHLDRVINKYNLDMIYIAGPGHSGQVGLANSYIEGTYSMYNKDVTKDYDGLKKLFKSFSFPGGTSSHEAPEIPGSINEGGELGYSLSHAYGTVLDNKNLIAACVIGDGEAETGPLATSWHGNKFINPKKDGTVLPILHLNGYKIANPTVLSRISDDNLIKYFEGLGYKPYLVDIRKKENYHEIMANALDMAIEDILNIKKNCNKKITNLTYPMIILKSKKGWTCPKIIDKKNIEDTHRSHQVPISYEFLEKDLSLLTKWFKSYNPEELFNDDGTIKEDILKLVPKESKKMSLSKYSNGGLLLKKLKLPNFENYKVSIKRGVTKKSDMRVLGEYLRDVLILNKKNFKLFSPDETASNRLTEIFKKENKRWNLDINSNDDYLSDSGNIFDSFLSEHFCEGLLEGYILTGRHGIFASYEAFIRIVDSMVSQYAKWLKVSKELSWRVPISSLNYILTSHIWQQDHNGYTHQDPGFLNHLATKKSDIVRMYFPIDANTLICTVDHVIKTTNYINVTIASKHESLQWLSMKEAKTHCENGLSIFDWASNNPKKPDIILASCGDTPNLEIIAAAKILKEYCPKINTRVINIFDLMKLESNTIHPHGLTDKEFDSYFTKNLPVIFAFHGYPNLIHELTYRRNNRNIHVHGYIEEGAITTAFDMRVLNKIDRYNLVLDSLKYLPKTEATLLTQKLMEKKLKEHKKYIYENGIDLEEIRNFKL